MRFVSKLITALLLIAPILLIFSFSPAYAAGTTVEIASGSILTLDKGDSIPGSATGGIPVFVKNLPEFEDGNGFAAFDLRIVWDAEVIRVDSITQASGLTGWGFAPNINNAGGDLVGIGFTSGYVQHDVTLFYLGITAIGDIGNSCPISFIRTELYDTTGETSSMIPASPVNATVRITGEQYLEITPADGTVIEGEPVQFTAELVTPDDEREDVTDQVIWMTGSETIATVESMGDASPGLVTGMRVGATMIHVQYEEISCSTTVTVTASEEDEPETEIEEPVETEQVEPDEPVDDPEPEVVDVSPAEVSETIDTSGQTETTEPVDPETTADTDDDAGSGLPIGWIIGGAAVFVAVIGTLGYTLFIRGRY